MGFIQTTFLLGLAGLAIPILIHLISRWQTQRVELGTIRFLSELLHETARRRRVKRWLLLAMRLACIALLVGLFARPFLFAQRVSGEGRLIVFLIDQSASMTLRADGQRLLDAAVDRVREVIADAGDNTDVEIGFFDSQVLAAGSDGDSSVPAASDIRAPELAFGATSFGTAFAWARDVCIKSQATERQVYFLSDMQRSGLDWTAVAAYPPDVAVHVEDLGREGINNIAVTRVIPGKTLIHPGEPVRVSVTLFNHGEFTISDVPLRLTLQSERRTVRREETVSLAAGQATEHEFELLSVPQGDWTGDVAVDVADDLSFDNRHYFALVVAPAYRVLIVDGSPDDPTGVSDGYFLQKAIGLATSGETSAASPYVARLVRYDEGGLPVLNDTDIVVLADLGDLSSSDAYRLSQFIEAGGKLLVFTGETLTAEAGQSLIANGLAPGEIRGIARTRDLPFRWGAWQDDHPLLAPFADPQRGDLRRLSFTAHTQIEPASGTQVLARFLDDSPALTQHRLGEGRVLWFLSSGGRAWSNWVRSRLYVPLIHQMLGDLVRLTGGGPVQFHRLDTQSPDNPVPVPDRPSVIEHDGRLHVFNVSSLESETERATADELAERFQFRLHTEESEAVAVAGLETSRNELWPYVACLLLVVMMIEWFVSNRTPA